jgi:hypothetical protein
MPSKNTGTQANSVTNKLQKAIAGMNGAWPTAQTTIVVLTVVYTPAQLIAKLQQVLSPFTAASDAKIAYQSALATRNAALPDAAAFIEAFFTVLPQYLPAGSASVSSFGSKPRKARTPLTVEQKQAALVKREATRKARGIMGKKQRNVSDFRTVPAGMKLPPIRLQAVA